MSVAIAVPGPSARDLTYGNRRKRDIRDDGVRYPEDRRTLSCIRMTWSSRHGVPRKYARPRVVMVAHLTVSVWTSPFGRINRHSRRVEPAGRPLSGLSRVNGSARPEYGYSGRAAGR